MSSSSFSRRHRTLRYSSSNRLRRDDPTQRETLKATAEETLQVLPGILDQIGTSKAARRSSKFSLDSLPRLHPDRCPSYPRPVTIRVVNENTLNAAIRLSHLAQENDSDPRRSGSQPTGSWRRSNPRPAVVNFANRHKPGGGWRNGAMAQEEALCYRSSLALSLNRNQHYPLATEEALYSPAIIATVRSTPDPRGLEKRVFARDRDRDVTKAKMRLALRMAAENRHGLLVLGALGCGVYGNPPEDVAHCWLEMLREAQFSGNWWRAVWFAIYDPKYEGNFEVFDRVLSGKEV